MRKQINVIIIFICSICLACNNKDNNHTDDLFKPFVESTSDSSHVSTPQDTSSSDIESSSNIDKSERHINTNNSYIDSETGFESESWEQGMYDGMTHGADDAINGKSKRYRYLGNSSQYQKGYKEGYDEAYAEGVNVTIEAEKEYDKIEQEYGLDDIDDYSDIDLDDY